MKTKSWPKRFLNCINGRIGCLFWYGHVLKVPVENGSKVESAWAALIAPSPHFVDAPTVDLVFGQFKYAMQVRANYIQPQAQHQDDVFAYRATYDALRTFVRNPLASRILAYEVSRLLFQVQEMEKR